MKGEGNACISFRNFPQPSPLLPQTTKSEARRETDWWKGYLSRRGRGYVGLGIGGRGRRGFWVRNPDSTLSPTPRQWAHSLIPGAAFHPDPNLHVLPNTQENLSHRLTPQIHTHVPTDTHTHTHTHTHAHAEAQTSRQVFPFLCLSLGLNFVQPHMLCVREGGWGRGRQG